MVIVNVVSNFERSKYGVEVIINGQLQQFIKIKYSKEDAENMAKEIEFCLKDLK